MHCRTDVVDEMTRVSVEGTVTESDLDALRDQLDAPIDVLDLSKVRRMDVYGLQIVIAALRTAEQKGRALQIVSGRIVCELARRAGWDVPAAAAGETCGQEQ